MDGSTPSGGSGSGYFPDYEASPGPDTPPLLSDDSDTSSSFHLSSGFETDQYYVDQLSSSHFDSMTKSWDGSSSGIASVAPLLDDDPPSASGSQQLNGPPPTSGRPPSQDHPTPESEAAQWHNPLPGSGDQQPSLVQYAVQSTSHHVRLPYEAVGTRLMQAIHSCCNSREILDHMRITSDIGSKPGKEEEHLDSIATPQWFWEMACGV
jgi:hypothetical protein